MRFTDKRSEHGTVLFISMMVLSFLTFMVHRLTREAHSYSRIARIALDGPQHQSAVRERLQSTPSSSHVCTEQPIFTDGTSKIVVVCSRGAPSFLTFPPSVPLEGQIDYAPIFSRSRDCIGHRTTAVVRSFSSPAASHTCSISSDYQTPLS